MHDGDAASVSTNLADIAETTQEALGEMRQLLFELRPQILDEHGLAAALRSRLQAVEARVGLTAEFECRNDIRLAPEREQELYRLAQEALSNVLKHARAGHVCVSLIVVDGSAVMEIEDDGVGFQTDAATGGFGLAGMRERVARLGGGLQVERAPGAGTYASMCLHDRIQREPDSRLAG
jgi:signal transduction histidine kinase